MRISRGLIRSSNHGIGTSDWMASRQMFRRTTALGSRFEELKYPKLGMQRIFAHAARLEGLLFLSILLVITCITGVIVTVGRLLLGTIKHHTKEILFQEF